MKKSELTENQIPTPVKGENNNRKKLPASDERLCFTDGMCGCCSDGFREGLKIADSFNRQERVYAAAEVQ